MIAVSVYGGKIRNLTQIRRPVYVRYCTRSRASFFQPVAAARHVLPEVVDGVLVHGPVVIVGLGLIPEPRALAPDGALLLCGFERFPPAAFHIDLVACIHRARVLGGAGLPYRADAWRFLAVHLLTAVRFLQPNAPAGCVVLEAVRGLLVHGPVVIVGLLFPEAHARVHGAALA